MNTLLRNLVPRPLLAVYHWLLAVLANWWYHAPSERMIVVGVTGTSGKSTVVEMLDSILKAAGHRVGVASTIRFQSGEQSWMNDTKMTMVGRFQLQHLLRQMVDAGCRYALVETTSLGIAQHRHVGVHYDVVALTNLYPEHLDAHGGFASYRRAKRELFLHLHRLGEKMLAGQTVPKAAVVNLDAPDARSFLDVPISQRYGFTLHDAKAPEGATVIQGSIVPSHGRFGLRVEGQTIQLQLPGEHNVGNALCAYAIARALGVPAATIAQGIGALTGIAGRIEFVRAGQPFTVVVDYAFEPVAMQKLYDVVSAQPHRRVIQVLGTTGGGRDRGRGRVLGEMAGRFADMVIATDEDPYDDDPRELIARVADGATAAGKVTGQNLFIELERRSAIRRAVQSAEPGDLVLITGKGCEQAMVRSGGKKVAWDDRQAVRDEIAAQSFDHQQGVTH